MLKNLLPELPDRGWQRVIFWTLVTTVVVTAVAVAASAISGLITRGHVIDADYYVAFVIAIIICLPVSGFLIIKLQQLSLANQKLHAYATTDSLTGILSRRAFTEAVEAKLQGSMKGNTPVHGSLLVIDVDHFKDINDQFGHINGDTALIMIAEAMQSCLRENDVCGRLGGEEFGVFLSETGAATATLAADRIRRTVANLAFAPDGKAAKITISIGVSTALTGTSFATLYKQGDARLYVAKTNGRDRVEWAQDSDSAPEPVAENTPKVTHSAGKTAVA